MNKLNHIRVNVLAAALSFVGLCSLPGACEPELTVAIRPTMPTFHSPAATSTGTPVRAAAPARSKRVVKKTAPAARSYSAEPQSAPAPAWRAPEAHVSSAPFSPDASDEDPMPLPVRRASAVQAVSYRLAKPAGIPCHVVQVDLTNPHVRLRTVRARDLGTRYRSFGSFVRQTRPIAAITGTFFDTQTGTIIANLVRDGKLLEAGTVGQTIALDDKNQASWLSTAGHYGGGHNWKDSEFAVSSGPSLVHEGEICLDPWSEGFSDPGLFRQAARTGVAITHSGKLLLVSVNRGVSLGRFARMMRELGARHALNLDGGSSTALYARGRYLSRPARRLTNVLLVTVRPGDPVPQKVVLDAGAAPIDSLVTEGEAYHGEPPVPEPVDLGAQTIIP